MRENLRATSYSDFTGIPPGCDTCSIPSISYIPYNYNESYADTYGYLYSGYTVTSSKNICPTGWRVPTDADWTNLISEAGGSLVAGGHLKEAGLVHWNSPNSGADNSSGFTALGGGYFTSVFGGILNESRWWSDNTLRYYRQFYNTVTITYSTGVSGYHNYIRCVK